MRDNSFDNIVFASQTERNNRVLQMLCNSYGEENEADWMLNPETPNRVLGPQGISCDVTDYRAGNSFEDGINEHVWNNAQPFAYVYRDELEYHPTVNLGIMIEYVCNAEGEIDPSCTATGPPYFLLAEQDSVLDVLSAEMATIGMSLDSSNTDTLLAHIADTLYSNTTLTTELLQYSLLSDTVLNAACSRYPFFAEAQFQDIIVKNSPVSRAVWPFLITASAKVKQAYRDTLIQAQATDTLRTTGLIEREIEIANTQRFRAIIDIAYTMVDSDTVAGSTHSLIHFLADTLPDKQWHMAAVGIALGADTLSWARSILDGVSLENADDSVFYNYYDLALGLAEDTLTWFSMDSSQIAYITEVATGESTLKHQAQAVQALVGDSSILRIPEQYQGTPSFRLAEGEPQLKVEEKSKVSVYPNPFKNQFNVIWELRAEEAHLYSI